jgi:hypothetical protein
LNGELDWRVDVKWVVKLVMEWRVKWELYLVPEQGMEFKLAQEWMWGVELVLLLE